VTPLEITLTVPLVDKHETRDLSHMYRDHCYTCPCTMLCYYFCFQGFLFDTFAAARRCVLLMPVTAAYVTAVIRSAIETKDRLDFGAKVSLNYAIVLFLFSALTLTGILYNVIVLTGAAPEDRRQIMIFEIVFGTGFGLIVADLFGKAASP
jgi:hypothetical protein